MFFRSLFFHVFLSCVLFEQIHAVKVKNDDEYEDRNVNRKHISKKSSKHPEQVQSDLIFSDVPDNSMRVPHYTYEKEPSTKRHSKKSPKRTVQKIIKKNKNKRKYFMSMVTSTIPPTTKIEESEELFSKDEVQTTETAHRRRSRNKNGRRNNRMRNPMPFQKIRKRTKREADRNGAFIIQDLDEVEFLGKKEGYNAMKVHVKKYW